jgi:hypothetical protein
MSIFFESPMPAILIGICLEAVLGTVLLATRRGWLFAPIVAVLLLTLGGVWLERAVVTEQERVEITVDNLAAALTSNDLAKVQSFIAPSAHFTRQRAAWALGMITVTDTRIHNLKITINKLASPPTAEAKFDGVIFFRGKMIDISHDRYPAEFTVEFEQDGDRWLVTDHIEYEQAHL